MRELIESHLLTDSRTGESGSGHTHTHTHTHTHNSYIFIITQKPACECRKILSAMQNLHINEYVLSVNDFLRALLTCLFLVLCVKKVNLIISICLSPLLMDAVHSQAT